MGGVIIAGEEYFGLTVAHAFIDDDMSARPGTTADPQLFNYDLNLSSDDESLSSEEEEDEEISQDSVEENRGKFPDGQSAFLRNPAEKGNARLTPVLTLR